jgi:hypothetical protein
MRSGRPRVARTSGNKTPIPLCRSVFLQDITIALGRRSLKSLRQWHTILRFEVSREEIQGIVRERLDIEAMSVLDKMTKITAWEDGAFWVYSRIRRGKPLLTPVFEIHANLAKMSSNEIASLIRVTLLDLESVEHVWKEQARLNPGASG